MVKSNLKLSAIGKVFYLPAITFVLFFIFSRVSYAQSGWYGFPYFDPAQNSWAQIKDWSPSGLTYCTFTGGAASHVANAFNAQVRYSSDPTERWEISGGITLTELTGQHQALMQRIYCRGVTNAVGKTIFNDVTFVNRASLEYIRDYIMTSPANVTWFNGLPSDVQDSVRNFYSVYKNGEWVLREGLLIIAGAYECSPNLTSDQCNGINCNTTNAALYVVDATTLEPLRYFEFFKCDNTIQSSNFSAIKYFPAILRFMAVGNAIMGGNSDVLTYQANLTQLIWPGITGAFQQTLTHAIQGSNTDNEYATGVEIRADRKQHPNQSPIPDEEFFLISGYTTRNGYDDSFILKLNAGGNAVAAKRKNDVNNDRAHAVTLGTNQQLLMDQGDEELAVSGYTEIDEVKHPYIAKFGRANLQLLLEGTYGFFNNQAYDWTATPGFSIVSSNSGNENEYEYSINGTLRRNNQVRDHQFYLKVNNTLNPIDNYIYPLSINANGLINFNTMGHRMITLNRDQVNNLEFLMLGKVTNTALGNIFGTCSCDNPPCSTSTDYWKNFTHQPLTTTRVDGSSFCIPEVDTEVILCESGCWSSITFNTTEKSIPAKKTLYHLILDVCQDDYCGEE